MLQSAFLTPSLKLTNEAKFQCVFLKKNKRGDSFNVLLKSGHTGTSRILLSKRVYLLWYLLCKDASNQKRDETIDICNILEFSVFLVGEFASFAIAGSLYA